LSPPLSVLKAEMEGEMTEDSAPFIVREVRP
jgi:hypothetical protein